MSTELAAQMVAQKAAAAGGQQVTFTAAAQPNAMRELEQEDTQGNDEEEQDGPPKLKEQVQFVSYVSIYVKSSLVLCMCMF